MIQQALPTLNVGQTRAERTEAGPLMGREFLEIIDAEASLAATEDQCDDIEASATETGMVACLLPQFIADFRAAPFKIDGTDTKAEGQIDTPEAKAAGASENGPDISVTDVDLMLSQPSAEPRAQGSTSDSGNLLRSGRDLAVQTSTSEDLRSENDPDAAGPLHSEVVAVTGPGTTADSLEATELPESADNRKEVLARAGHSASIPNTAPESIVINSLKPAPLLSTRADSIWQTRPKLEAALESEDDAETDLPTLPIIDSASEVDVVMPTQTSVELLFKSSDTNDNAEKETLGSGVLAAGNPESTRSSNHLMTPEARFHVLQPEARPLPPGIASQLVDLAPSARSSGVEVVLDPEELGKVRFEIHHSHDTIRIVLTAERAETVEMLKRHSDQLLQEFRQSGFSGASLSFGQWGQQDKPNRPVAAQALGDVGPSEVISPSAPTLALPVYSEGQGLNLRL